MSAPYILEEDVVKEVMKYFHGDDISIVTDKLINTNLWAENSGPPARIHIAMIWKSKGDIKVFLNSILYDSGDWRELLVETKLAINWKEKLLKEGINTEKWIVL